MNDNVKYLLTKAGGGCWHKPEVDVLANEHEPMRCSECGKSNPPANRTFTKPDDYFWLLKNIVGSEFSNFIMWYMKNKALTSDIYLAWYYWTLLSPTELCDTVGEWFMTRGHNENENRV